MFYDSVDYRDLLQGFWPENGQFLGETLSVSPRDFNRKLCKHNPPKPRGWGHYIDSIRVKVL